MKEKASLALKASRRILQLEKQVKELYDLLAGMGVFPYKPPVFRVDESKPCTCVSNVSGPYTFTNDFDCDQHNADHIQPISRATPAYHCYHANENPFTCPCPKNCYCKDGTCKGKVSW